jgi:hypothetical protein
LAFAAVAHLVAVGIFSLARTFWRNLIGSRYDYFLTADHNCCGAQVRKQAARPLMGTAGFGRSSAFGGRWNILIGADFLEKSDWFAL